MDPVNAEVRTIENENGKFTYVKLPERPADIPEKFWNPENGLNVSALNAGYQKLESGRAQFMEETKRNVRQELEQSLPKAPPEYKVTAPAIEGAPPGFQFQADGDPVVALLREAGKNVNLTQEGFDALVAARAKAAAGEFKATGERTVTVLGEKAPERITKVQARLNEVLGAELGKALAGAVNDPQAVLAIEKLVGGGTPGGGDSGYTPQYTEQDLRAKMRDPRYYDPMRRDPNFVREIEEGFKKLYGGQQHDGQPHFTSR